MNLKQILLVSLKKPAYLPETLSPLKLKLNTIIHPYVFKEIDMCFKSVLSTGKHEIFLVGSVLNQI